MNRKELFLFFQKQLAILVKRKRNLENRLIELDNLPLLETTEKTYKRWHEAFCKANYLGLRIEILKNKLELGVK